MDTFQSLEKRLLSRATLSMSLISEGESPLYTEDARERIPEGSSASASIIRWSLICSGMSSGMTGFKTPSSKMASTAIDMAFLAPFFVIKPILTEALARCQYYEI